VTRSIFVHTTPGRKRFVELLHQGLTGRFHGLIMRRSKPECDARFGQRYAGWVSARRRVESTPLLGRSQSASRSVLWVAAAKRATRASEIFSGSGAGRLLSGGGKPA